MLHHVPLLSIICFVLSRMSSTYLVDGINMVYDEFKGNGVKLDPTYYDHVVSFDVGNLCFNLFIVIAVSLCWATIAEDNWGKVSVWFRRLIFILLSLCALVSYILVIAHIFVIMAFVIVFAVAKIVDLIICPFLAELSEEIIAEVEEVFDAVSSVDLLDDFSTPSDLDDEISESISIEPYCDSANKVSMGVQLILMGVFIMFFTSLHISYNIVWLLKHCMCLGSHLDIMKKVKDDHNDYIKGTITEL